MKAHITRSGWDLRPTLWIHLTMCCMFGVAFAFGSGVIAVKVNIWKQL